VFSAHGSGIGVGLVAGKLLAEAVAGAGALSAYERRFQREHGGLLAAYDLFRRHAQGMSVAELATLMRVGLLDAESARAGTAQVWPSVGVSAAAAKLMAARQAPRQALALAAVGARMAALAGLYRAYPDDPKQLRRWSRAVARLVGDAVPDVV
jgi:menaquinone-9 beta-reductase